MQKVMLIGRLGGDPSMRYTSESTPVANFSLATTRTLSKALQPVCPQGWKEGYNGNNWELTTWWRVTCWRGLAEVVNQYLAKGRQVYVEGQVNGANPRVWTGDDGIARASYEITAQSVEFLGGNGSAAATEEDEEEEDYLF